MLRVFHSELSMVYENLGFSGLGFRVFYSLLSLRAQKKVLKGYPTMTKPLGGKAPKKEPITPEAPKAKSSFFGGVWEFGV